MPTYTPITAPEGANVRVFIEAHLDGNGDLAFRTAGTGAAIPSHAAIGCDSEQVVRTIIQDFTDTTGASWQVSATPQLRTSGIWTSGQGEVYDEGSGWTDFVEITVTAQNTNANGETTTKTKKIKVQTKSRKGLPGTRRPNL